MALPSRWRGPEYWRRFIPPNASQVDWANPLCADLRILTALSGPSAINLVSGEQSTTITADPAVGSSIFGQASVFSGGHGQLFTRTTTDAQFSGAALIQASVGGLTQSILDSDDPGASKRYFQFRLTTANEIEIVGFNATPTPLFTTLALPEYLDGAPVAFSINGTFHKVMGAGSVLEVTQASSAVALPSTAQVGVGSRVYGANYFNGAISMVALWGRALSAEEMVEWARYPGQLFKAQGRRVISFGATTGATGSAAITESTDTATGTGGIIVVGSGSITGASDSVAAVGGIIVQGSASITGADDSVSASGSVSSTVSGSAAITEGGDSVVAVSATQAAGRIKPKPSKRRVLVDGKLMELTPAELGKVVKKRIAQAEARAKPDEAPKPVQVEVLPVQAKKGADVVDEPRETYRAPSVAISMPAEFVPDFQIAAPDVMARIVEQHRQRIEAEAQQERERTRRRQNDLALEILMLTL